MQEVSRVHGAKPFAAQVVSGGKNLADENVDKRKQALANFTKLTVSFFGDPPPTQK